MRTKPPSIKKKTTLLEGKYLRFMLTTYVDAYGTERQWEAFERVNCRGIVVIVPVTNEGETILTKQFRPPVNNYVIEFPAGLNDKGDTLEEAAKRELIEETGYSAKELTFLTEGPMSSGASGEILTAYLAQNLEYRGIGERDEAEDIEIIKVPVEKLEERLSELQAEGNFVDLKIYGLIELARKHLTQR
ncbi:MAG: NUDIX hydrolase [Thermodesulfovibrionales bacterium]|nr:NUDIX hydrolase [Thermodesulfovibrionales bacterium]